MAYRPPRSAPWDRLRGAGASYYSLWRSAPNGNQKRQRLLPLIVGLVALVLVVAFIFAFNRGDAADATGPGSEQGMVETLTPIPTSETRVHVVEAGDTLWDIALEYGTTVEALVEANTLADPSQLQIGQELVIPLEP